MISIDGASFLAWLAEDLWNDDLPLPDKAEGQRDGDLKLSWEDVNGLPFEFVVGSDQFRDGDARGSISRTLGKNLRPGPRRYAVLVHKPIGLKSLGRGNSTAVQADTPQNRERLGKDLKDWQRFYLVEQE